VLLGACSSQIEPAQQALKDAEAAVNAASPDAGRYMPDRLSALQSRLANAKAAFEKKDYATVLAAAPDISIEAKSVAQTAAAEKETAKKEEVARLEAQWMDLSSAVSKLMDPVKARIDELSKNKHAAKGVALAPAKADLADATSLWEKAHAAHASGDLQQAVSLCKDTQAKLEAAAGAVKVNFVAAESRARVSKN
jgi:hypothetical protein